MQDKQLIKIINFFIERANKENEYLSPLKLIKLVYIAYASFLTCFDKHLFKEKVEAWQYGPVIPSIYHDFKHYHNNHISDYYVPYPFSEVLLPNGDNDQYAALLEEIWSTFKGWKATELSSWTHQKESAWSRAYKRGRNSALKKEEIRNEFKNYLNISEDERLDQDEEIL